MPFTISHYPKRLKGLILEIENHLPEYLKLPHNPKGEIRRLFQTLTCTTALDSGGLLVIVSIPLSDNMNTFEFFKTFNMPVPVKDSVVPTDQLPSIVAWYRLETSSLSVEQEHFTSPL